MNLFKEFFKAKNCRLVARVFLIFLLANSLSGCQANPAEKPDNPTLQEYKGSFFALDTLIMVSLYADSPEKAQATLTAAEEEFRRINDLTDRFAAKNLPDPNRSDVYRVNQNPGQWVAVSPDTIEVVSRALAFGTASGGTFNIGLGRISDLWDFKGSPGIPDPQDLTLALQAGDYKDIEIDGDKIRIKPGVFMDLGAVAKGYATDKAADCLRRLQIEHAIINAGGNVLAIGSRPDGTPWRVGVSHPREREEVFAIIPLVNEALVTSGDYERFFEVDGKRYHHIIDPQSGTPAEGCISATIKCANSADADMMSTAVFVLGPKAGLLFLETYPPNKEAAWEGLVCDANMQVFSTSGFNDLELSTQLN